MPSSKTRGSDKELKEGRQQRHAILFIWGIIGTIGIIIILYGESKLKQASASVEWPVVPGRIVTSEVNCGFPGEIVRLGFGLGSFKCSS